MNTDKLYLAVAGLRDSSRQLFEAIEHKADANEIFSLAAYCKRASSRVTEEIEQARSFLEGGKNV